MLGKREDISIGDIVETCSLHLGEVLKYDEVNDVLATKSIFDGEERWCSLYSCGVEKQSKEQIELKTQLWNEGGIRALIDYFEEELARTHPHLR